MDICVYVYIGIASGVRDALGASSSEKHPHKLARSLSSCQPTFYSQINCVCVCIYACVCVCVNVLEGCKLSLCSIFFFFFFVESEYGLFCRRIFAAIAREFHS